MIPLKMGACNGIKSSRFEEPHYWERVLPTAQPAVISPAARTSVRLTLRPGSGRRLAEVLLGFFDRLDFS
ncbi:MAG TPA: hypothetical protein VGB26_05030 [Nitrospiria bacterium]